MIRQQGRRYELRLETPSIAFMPQPVRPGEPTQEQAYHADAARRFHELLAPLAGTLDDAIEALLPPGHQSLGTQLNVGHYAATPVGMSLRATAVVTRVDGRTVEFRVEAFDDKERVGDGSHTRVVVNVERFDQRVQRKLNS